MSENFQVITFEDTVLVIFGTFLGSFFRCCLIEWFAKFSNKKYLATIFVNSLATFCLAIITYSKFAVNSSYILFLSVGIIGSLSTFSTFIGDVFQTLQKRKISEGFLIVILSIILSLLCGLIGYSLTALYS